MWEIEHIRSPLGRRPRAAFGRVSGEALAAGLYAARYGLECLPAETVYRVDVLGPLLIAFGAWSQSEKM